MIYGLVGIFGAARYGQRTEGDLLVNDWLGGGRGEGALDAAVVVYLAISMPPIQVSQKLQPATHRRAPEPAADQAARRARGMHQLGLHMMLSGDYGLLPSPRLLSLRSSFNHPS